MTKKLKSYVSEIDRLLQRFDEAHPDKSAAQQAEIDKFQRVQRLRDEAISNDAPPPHSFWESF
ncbi:MAG: CBU_0585 family protein [Gammaproteobacteria bacterium]|nr:CBU_0585 family protein [Gammaproteobacteria bacterium]